jgi:hypothetical protein
MKTYTIELNEKQATLLSSACELIARLGINQMKEVFRHLPIDYDNIDYTAYYDDQFAIESIIKKYIKKAPFDGHLKEKADIAWDLYQVIRNQLSWEWAIERGIVSSKDDERNWKEMSGVSYDEPMKISKEPLAKITVNK